MIPLPYVMYDTRLSQKEITAAQKRLRDFYGFDFVDDWIVYPSDMIPNYSRGKSAEAYKKELKKIPGSIRNLTIQGALHSTLKVVSKVPNNQQPINNNKQTITNKQQTTNKKGKKEKRKYKEIMKEYQKGKEKFKKNNCK